jgi:hypothetical protein
MISGQNIQNSIARTSIMGKHQPRKQVPANLNLQEMKLPKRTAEKLGRSTMSEEAYLNMVEYAKWLPRGKRSLRYNMNELKEMLLSNDLKETPLTKMHGLNAGGKLAFAEYRSEPAIKKLLTQTEQLQEITIKNNNRVKSEYNLKGGFNPNYTSFKNNIRL